jgi:N-acetylmuramidase/Putative peptidoglycan binding domain
MFEGEGRPLSEAGLAEVAGKLGAGLPALWAVMTVETRGCGFMSDRRPVILYERHIFHRRTNGKFDDAAPDISHAAAGGYGARGDHQYERLARAIALDRTAALESTSWGLGQVMGFNAADVGFRDVEAMVAAMSQSEDLQFQAMAGFIAGNNLSSFLQQGDWAGFAYRYNGTDYQKNAYDTKLAKAHARYATGPLPSVAVRAAQLFLTYLDYAPGGVDGWFGTRTQNALIKFQRDKGLSASGRLDATTLSAIEKAALG